MEPTKEQIQWFWEQCIPERREANRLVEGLPNIPIDLNNLFKYTVPKLKELHPVKYWNILYFWILDIFMGKDPALALFWAIYKALGGEDVRTQV